MAQVKFLQGLRENLPRELSPGAIYFTQDERKLYIDTELARLPVVGDCGKIFYLQFNHKDWTSDRNDNNNLTKPSIFITDYIETYTDSSAKTYSLDQLYHEEIILFTGTVFYLDNQNNKIELSNIICKGFEKNADSGKVGLKFQYVGSDFSASFPADNTALKIYIQMYTPNPKSNAYIPQAINTTVYSNSYKLRGQEFWELIDKTDPSQGYKQTIQVFGVDLTKQPYIVSRNDDSLENTREYNKIEDIETSYENNISTLTFKIKDEPPAWVISIDLFIMLDIPNNNNECEWSAVTIPADELLINDSNTFIMRYNNNNFYKLKQITGTQNRELVVFCAQENNELYKNITNVGYSNSDNSFTFTFNPEVKDLTDIQDTTLYICQMNNIANQIIEATIKSNTWKRYETSTANAVSENTESYYVSVFSPSVAFLGKHQPLIYALENSEAIFNKINEVKIYNGSLMLYSKEEITEDMELKIIDFK